MYTSKNNLDAPIAAPSSLACSALMLVLPHFGHLDIEPLAMLNSSHYAFDKEKDKNTALNIAPNLLAITITAVFIYRL
jgi:hypothetical protein